MSKRYVIPAELFQTGRKICSQIRYVLNNETRQRWKEEPVTVAYEFIKTVMKLAMGAVIIVRYHAYRRQNIIEHSPLKVKSVRKDIIWNITLHSYVADND